MSLSVNTIVLGGTGYVAGELLRLLAGHPHLDVAAVLSDSQPGARIADAFPHLQSAYPDLQFSGIEAIECLRSALQAPIPAFLISGDTAPERLIEARASGYQLLHKPVSPMRLRALVSQLLKRADATP